MKITIVKKVKADGCLCRKSNEVWTDLQASRLLGRIDRIVFAHADKPQGEGMSLAIKHQVRAAPFFIVEREDNSEEVYTDYSHFLQEILKVGVMNQANMFEELN